MSANGSTRWTIRRIRTPARKFWESLDPQTKTWVTDILCECPKIYPNDPNGKRKGHMKGRKDCIWHLRHVSGDKAIFYALDEAEREIELVDAGSHDMYDR